jgi:beta-mannosidase
MDLSGRWLGAVADEDLRRNYPEPAFDDRSWAPLDVPGHWRSADAFAADDGPLLYRRHFEAPSPSSGRRAWLTFDGIFYEGDVWLDGSYVGVTEGYFFPHTFEVTNQLRSRSEHVLAVEVGCPRPTDRAAKRSLTGIFQHWDCFDPDWTPGGIWRPVRVSETGPVRISRLRVLCADAKPERAVLEVRAVLDAAHPGQALLRTTVTGVASGSVVAQTTNEQTLAAGENRIRLSVPVTNPDLWWPHALGDQPLHDVTVEVLLTGADDSPASISSPAADDQSRFSGGPLPRRAGIEPHEPEFSRVSDRVVRRTGIRQVRMKNWVATVNGERLFLKGSNLAPTRMALAEASPAELEADVTLAREAGLDLIRVHAHVTRPELYEAADRQGVLVWQDMPLQWGYAHGVRKQAVRQARELVDLLGHHPSIAIWCGHNEPLAIDLDHDNIAAEFDRNVGRMLLMQELPTWNKTVLDGSIKRALERSDPSRPVIPHSGIFPHPGSSGTDSHLYFGWYVGQERSFPGWCQALPTLARFVTEFGAQAVPDNAEFMEPERWPDLDWSRLIHTYSLQRSFFDRYVPPDDYQTFDAWREATQDYQATVVRYHVETLRRLKYRPAGGFCQFSFADPFPGVTWALLDHQRAPKRGLQAFAEACAPVIVVATRPAVSYRPHEPLVLDIHVVSDLRVPVPAARVTATLGWEGGNRTWAWEGDIPADECVKVGTVQREVPASPGPLTLELVLEATDLKTTNRYEAVIAG